MDERKRFPIELTPSPSTGELPDIQEVYDRIYDADWSDDPGTGRAVMLDDGREVLNPVPMAPPLGYRPEPSIMEMIATMLARQKMMIEEDAVTETEEEANDYEVEEEWDPVSRYEIIEMNTDFPHAPAGTKPAADVETAPAASPEPSPGS